jgi:hypothetical protein
MNRFCRLDERTRDAAFQVLHRWADGRAHKAVSRGFTAAW